MRTLRNPPQPLCSAAATPSSFPANCRCAAVHRGDQATALAPRFEPRPRGLHTVARLALDACKDRALPAGSVPLTVIGVNVHGPRDSDNRMCAQR